MLRTSTKTFGEHVARAGKTARAGRTCLRSRRFERRSRYLQMAPDAFARDARAGER